MERRQIEQLLGELYAARVRGDLDALCRIFSKDAKFQIAGASHEKPVVIHANGMSEFRPWLALLIKTFRLIDQTTLSTLIDGERAAVHWRVHIHSRITGAMVLTELIDLVEVGDGQVTSYTEFFVPR